MNLKSGFISSMGSGAISGVLGAFVASPFFLVKTRMQSYTGGSAVNAVGHQHSYVSKGILFSIQTICRDEGFRGIFRYRLFIIEYHHFVLQS